MIKIDIVEFEQELEKLCHLCGFVVKKSAIESYYQALKNRGRDAILAGMKLMTADPPSKLTLHKLIYFINETKIGDVKSVWNGKECSDPECSMGLLFERIEGYRYVFKCPKCNGSSYPFQEKSS